jgi:hypothetical protein
MEYSNYHQVAKSYIVGYKVGFYNYYSAIFSFRTAITLVTVYFLFSNTLLAYFARLFDVWKTANKEIDGICVV